MALAYLIDPEIQFSDKSGMLNVAGFLRVYLNGTDDRAVTYKDFNGTLNEADIILDNNGRAVVVADSSKAYRLEVYNREGALLWTTYPLETLKGGGGGTAGFNVVSSDGTVEVNKYSSGGVANFDLSVNYDFDQSNVLVAASGALASDGDFQFTSDPITSDGERIYLEYGQIRAKSGWYHFDASVEITWSGTPANCEAAVVVTGPYEAERVMFDLSYAHKECLTIAGDVDIGTDGTPITFAIQGMPTGMSATVVNASVHALVAGSAGGGTGPSYQPGTGIVIEGDTISIDQSTVAMQSDLPDMSAYQEKLTTGDGISIDGNNEISVKTDNTTITVNADGELVATGGTGPSYQAGTGIVIEGDTISVDQSTVAMQSDLPDMSGYQEKLTTGDGISIDQNNEISVKTDGTTITVNANGELVATGGSFTQVQADYAQTNDQSVDYIKNKPDLSVFARSADLAPVATSGDYDDLTNKPSIPAAQVNADWNSSNGVSEILNKPSLAAVATSGDYNDLTNTPVIPPGVVVDQVYDATSTNAQSGTAVADAISGKQDTISDLSDIRSGAALGATAVQPGDLATVATTGNYSDLNGTPTLATVATTGDYNDLTNTPTIPAAQVNSDWNAASGVAQILNKPSLATVATSGDYSDLTNKPTIPAAQVNSDWDATSGVQEILNKPTLAAVATSGSYTDLTNTPTITDLLPSITGHGGDILAVNSGATGVEWVDNESNVFYATYNSTTIDDILAAYNNGKAVFVTKGVEIIPLSGILGTGNLTIAEFRMPQIINSSITRPGTRVWVNAANVWSSETSTQLNADWNASSGVTQILNKPTIPAAQVNSDWNASSGVSQILNKPTLAAVATSGAYSDLTGTPTINNVPAVTSSDDDKVLKASYSGGVGSYSWEADGSDVPAYTTSDDGKVLGVVDNQGTASLEWVTPSAGTVTDVEVNGSSVVSGGVASITIPAQVQSDWLESDSADPAYIINKPSIPVVPPTKDLVAGTGINIVQGVNDVTISATDGVPSVTSSDGGKVLTAAYSGGAGSFSWESLPATREVPTVTSSDDAKVLTATYSGGTGSFAWASLPAAPTLSSLNTAGITDIQVVQALPASPVATVLYLIEET